MKNKFVFIGYSNYSFVAPLRVKLDDIEVTVNCKIDTGCMKTSIPVKRLLIGSREEIDAEALQRKEKAIANGIEFERSYGVSDTPDIREGDRKLIKAGKLAECKALKFKQTAERFEIANFDLGETTIGVNYDRTGNILIGMDILEKWDVHIGEDVNTGKIIFLGCPKAFINDDYLLALEDHLKIQTSIASAIARKA